MSDLVKSERWKPKMRTQVVGAYVEPNIPIKKIREGNTFFDCYDYENIFFV